MLGPLRRWRRRNRARKDAGHAASMWPAVVLGAVSGITGMKVAPHRTALLYPFNGSESFHTRTSLTLRVLGQVALLPLPILLVVAAAGGEPWLWYVFGGAFLVAVTSLLLSATGRNINRWRRQAAAGVPPQSIGIVNLAVSQAFGMERSSVDAAETGYDAEHARRIRRERKQRQTADAVSVEVASEETVLLERIPPSEMTRH